MPILTPNWQWSLVYQKTLLVTSNNLINEIVYASLLDDKNYANNNIDINTKVKSNLDNNTTGKNNNIFCKNDFTIYIEKLFQQIQD